VHARSLVNAAGPWVEDVLSLVGAPRRRALRLVKGSHIVVPRLYDGDHAYTLQGSDGRVVFAIPYDCDLTLVGTTDLPYDADPALVRTSPEETEYLCRVLGEYLRAAVTPAQVVWDYSGVRPLFDDGAVRASTVTRDYVFDLDAPDDAAPVLSVFGGKLTTYRRLAEHALGELLPRLSVTSSSWTRAATLPGGDLPDMDLEAFSTAHVKRYEFAPPRMIRRMCRAYGTRVERILGLARRSGDLGEELAPELFEAELEYLREHEWARSAEDALWRRSKMGLALDAAARRRVSQWFGREPLRPHRAKDRTPAGESGAPG
jgi:glycerol-3-phosphate dehydrogenase